MNSPDHAFGNKFEIALNGKSKSGTSSRFENVVELENEFEIENQTEIEKNNSKLKFNPRTKITSKSETNPKSKAIDTRTHSHMSM